VETSALPQATATAPLRHTTPASALRRAAHRAAPCDRRQPSARRHCHLHGGDWEGDTIVGKGAVRIVTLVERKTGLVRLRRVESGAADPTMRAILHALYPVCARVHTLTWDNGS
jgi:IS30 family transposase